MKESPVVLIGHLPHCHKSLGFRWCLSWWHVSRPGTRSLYSGSEASLSTRWSCRLEVLTLVTGGLSFVRREILKEWHWT